MMEQWQAQPTDLHPAEPSQVLRVARAASVLLVHCVVVGCEESGRLSVDVAAAVPTVTRQAHELVDELLVGLTRASGVGAAVAGAPRQ